MKLTMSALLLLVLLPHAAISQQTAGEDPILRVGGSVIAPTIAFKVDPQYSDQARKAGIQGTVVMQAVIEKDGSVQILRIIRGIGFGLDENAVEALRQWRFRPATRDGVPVRVALNIE